MNITVNPSHTTATIKPLHACGGGPKTGGHRLSNDATEIFREIGIPYCRLHDIEYPYGSSQFVDVHCIFPDFDADENAESSYNFKATDRYLLAIKESGAEVFYRLGESIDHYENKLYIHAPKDFAKWARICEHIIRHYNQGWADGHYMNIKYWEIWNEPVGDCMWRGTYTEFYEFYTVVSKHLKSCFPNLKIGGYSCVGVYEKVRDRNNSYVLPLFDTVLPFMDGFFDYIEGKNVPLDFFSWHSYTLSPEETVASANYVRQYLDERGYKDTESLLTEFNMFYSFDSRTLYQHTEFPADLLANYIDSQNAPIDMLFYYDLQLLSYNAMFYKDPLDRKIKKLPAFYSMKFFGDLYRLKKQIEVEYEAGKGIYALGASDGEKGGVAIASRFFEGKLTLSIPSERVTVSLMHGCGELERFEADVTNGSLELDVQKETIVYIEF